MSAGDVLSERVILLGLFIAAAVLLTIFAGLDVDNAWTGIGGGIGGYGIAQGKD